MKTKLLTAALMAAMLVPAGAATAQTRELNRDRQEIREEQRELQRAQRRGDPRDVREERRDVRDARQEYREDWREYRQRNRNLYRAPAFRANFRYNQFSVGSRIAPNYWGNAYRVNNVQRWRLPAAGRSMTYVRHYNDLLLVNTRTGRVVRVYNGFYW